MDFKNFDWSFKSIAKVVGLIIAGIIVLTIVISLVSLSFKTVFQFGGSDFAFDDFDRGGYGFELEGLAVDASPSVRSLSRQIVVPPPPGGFSTGETAEDYEVREHFASVETRKLEETCDKISDLKKLDYVIFENANVAKKSCNFTFKVKRANEAEILEIVEGLDPETLNTRIHTIKRIVDDYDSELEILEKKLASIEETLAEAQSAYDELQTLATRKVDIESLAKIIDSKLNLIERLTNQRINIRTQIDRFNKAKSEQLDRLNFVYFNVNILESLFIDFERIKDTWKEEIQAFFTNVNEMIQNVTVTLLEYVLRFLLVAVYFFVSLILLKVVWVVTKKIWKRKGIGKS